jgi:hypothetical protein
MSKQISRRKYLKYVAGGVIGAAAVGAGAYWYLSTQGPQGPQGPTPKRTVRYMGHPFWFPQDAAAKWKELTGQDVECTYDELYVICQRQVADPKSWDWGGGGRYRPVISANILRPIPLEKLPRWRADKVVDIFNNPSKYFPPKMAERFSQLLWYVPGESLIAVPQMWNFDSVTYLPEFVPYEERGGEATSISYSELWNSEWKGRTAFQDEGFTTFTETANELNATGQFESENFTNMNESEVDTIFNFLLPIVKSGQIKTFWFKYGDIVNLFTAKEVYLASTWQPVCFDVRKAGVPAYYARLVNGPFFWYNSFYISKYVDDEMFNDLCTLTNWCLELWMQMLYTKQGYPTPAWAWEDYRNAMGEEMFGWFFTGNRTYLPINQIMTAIWGDTHPEFANLPARLQHALFLPDVYFKHFWTGEPPRTGSPDPNGNLRDLGSVEDKEKITRYYLSPDLPDKNDYYVTKWEELKANVPA